MARPELWCWGDSPATLREAIERGAVLVIPTESSYALAVDPRRRRAVAKVYRIKGRDAGSPLPVVAGDRAQLADLGADLSHPALGRLAAAWPAPLSLVAPLLSPLPAAGGAGTLAVRLPAHQRLRRLLVELGCALTATSANRSGRPPLLDPRAVADLLAGEDAVVLDDGLLPGGPPSTLIAADGDGLTVLRRGRYPMAEVRRLAQGCAIADSISADSVEISVDREAQDASS